MREPPKERGKILYIPDVQERLGKMPNGKPPSDDWINRNVAPTKKLKIGRYSAWYEYDVEAWIAGDRESA